MTTSVLHISGLLLAISSLIPLAACDEGDIPYKAADIADSGRTARLTGSVSKTEEWPTGYSVSLAGFGEDEYALVSKTVDASVLDNEGEILLSGIPSEVSSIELCVIDRLRRRVATFASTVCRDTSGEIMLDAGKIDAGMMQAVQQEVFNTTCINCHGTANAACGLTLLQGDSHRQLADVESRLGDGMARVAPGDADASLLWQIISTDRSSTWKYDHSVEVVQPTRLELVRNWINAGAPK